MNLSELKFSVVTKELLDAKQAIDNLSTAMSKLNKATADETKAAIDNEKVKQQQAKTVEANAKAAKAEADAISAKEKATKVSTESTKENTSVLDRQKSILEFMTQGYSKGQSTVLAYAKANGTAANDIKQLGDILEVQRKLMGASPFDKSMSGLVALKNQYGEVREAIRQYNADSGLSSNQTRELARDKERIIEKLKQEGAGLSQIKQAIREYNTAYVEQANKVNALSKVEKDRERSMRETANASRNVQAAEERLFSTVSHLNGQMSANAGLNERAALALGSYERNLRLAGITGEDAAKRLQKFKAAQEQVSAMEAKRRGDYVARGIGVQMGDVGVSLASGMNPLTVAIQQSDQIRGLIQQSGLEATQMAGIMQQAFKGIITSFKDVGVAMGSFVVGGIKSVGDGVYNLINSFGTIDKMAMSVANTLVRLGADPLEVIDALEASTGKLKIAFSVLGTVAAVTATAIAVNFYQTIKANDALRLSVITSGAALGATSDEMIKLAENTRKAGSSSNELKSFFSVLATEGFKFKGQLEAISLSSQQFSSVTGESLAEIAKEYAAMQKDPVKALTELAIKTGEVDVATVELVRNLSDAGMRMDAARIATEALSSAHTKMAEKAKQELSAWSLLWIDVKGHISDVGTALTSLANNGSMQKIVAGLGLSINGLAALNTIKSDIGTLTSLTASGDERQAAFERLQKLQENFNKDNQQYADILNGVVKPAIDNATSATSNSVYQSEKYRDAIKSELGGLKEKVKELSKEEYIRRKIQELRRKAGTPILAAEDFNGIRKKAAEEWEKANKKPIDSALSREESFYSSAIEKISNLNIKATTTTDSLTKAQQLLLDLQASEKWDSKTKQRINLWDQLSERDRAFIEAEIEKANVIELTNKAFENRNKLEKELASVKVDYQVKGVSTLEEINNKTTLLKMSEEERVIYEAILNVEKERKATIEKINEISANKARSGADILETEAARVKAITQADSFYQKQKEDVKQATQDQQEYARSFSAGWDNAYKSYIESTSNAAKTGQMLFERMVDGMTDAIVQFAMTGKLSIRDFANTFLAEMLKMQVKAAATSIMGNSSSGIGSLLTGIFTGGTQSPAPVVTPTMQTAGPEIYQIPGMGTWSSGGYTGAGSKNQPAGIVHKGEVVWSQDDVSRAGGVAVVDAMRRGVNGYATGGIVGNTTSPNTRGDTSVVVNNYSSSNITTEEVPDGRGGRKVNIIISEIAGNEVRRSGSPLNKSIRNSFGLAPALNGR